MSLENRVSIVTGASRGIGKAIADELGKLGAIVIGTATTEEGAAAIGQRFKESGIQGAGRRLNVTDKEGIVSFVKSVSDEYGAPSILVNNAGITQDNILMRMKDDQWDAVIETNLSAVFRLTKTCLRGMTKARWGRIINISSVVGSMGNAGQTNYAATKAGVEGFSRALAREIGARGITVNTVAPGFIDTDMTRTLPEAQREILLTQIPLGRLGQADEIAAAVVFLASDAGAYITGTTLHVNGGMYM